MALVKYNNNSISSVTSAASFPAGAMTLIKTLTASSSGTLSFVNGSSDVVLDSTYPIYLFKFINCHPATDTADFTFNMSADTGSNYNVTKTTTFFDAIHSEDQNDQSVNYSASRDLAQSTSFQKIARELGADNDQAISGTLYLFNPSSTTFVKHFMSNTNNAYSGNYSMNHFVAGYGNTTSAVDAVQFKMSSGNIDAGTIKLYGIKDS
tara:strand:+ start:210 stop:833 length:624 start_codon:yes stop_codon:yes gene_type:complete